MSPGTCYQINLQEDFGGGEVYTRFFTRALRELGWDTVLFVNPRARYWHHLGLQDTSIIEVASYKDALAQLPGERPLVVTHTAMPADDALAFADRTLLTGMLHMPLYERFPSGLLHYRLLFGVSQHVIASARARGLTNVYDEPLYGIADLDRRRQRSAGEVREGSPYDWDRRKFRDRLLAAISPWLPRRARVFQRKPGLTLGILSRITPIKQFPAMFELLSPIIARYPNVNVEIFGSGGYASVRDLRRALEPIRAQVRFWGQQEDVASVYPQLDYVLSGLPEKEALGLNLIEAQYSGTPVLAVRAAPFDETVRDGETGFLFDDPRTDKGASFAALLARLAAGAARPSPGPESEHLLRFSRPAFTSRLQRALDAADPEP
jgi:glycosyltransferase involved in cell wall biosynthesis